VRETREVVLIVFAVTIAAVVVSAVVGLLAIELVHPETDTYNALNAVWNVAALMLGAVVGYLFGRRRNGH
jgi:hypothetical protein